MSTWFSTWHDTCENWERLCGCNLLWKVLCSQNLLLHQKLGIRATRTSTHQTNAKHSEISFLFKLTEFHLGKSHSSSLIFIFLIRYFPCCLFLSSLQFCLFSVSISLDDLCGHLIQVSLQPHTVRWPHRELRWKRLNQNFQQKSPKTGGFFIKEMFNVVKRENIETYNIDVRCKHYK